MTRRRGLLEVGAWNPYVAGALASLLMVASVWITGKYFGASTTFVRSAGMIESVFGPERINAMDYFIFDPVQKNPILAALLQFSSPCG